MSYYCFQNDFYLVFSIFWRHMQQHVLHEYVQLRHYLLHHLNQRDQHRHHHQLQMLLLVCHQQLVVMVLQSMRFVLAMKKMQYDDTIFEHEQDYQLVLCLKHQKQINPLWMVYSCFGKQ